MTATRSPKRRRMTRSEIPDLSDLVIPGRRIAVRVTPRAGRDAVIRDTPLRLRLAAPPVEGQANEAARRLLARALGVAPSRLELVQGHKARDKVFLLCPAEPD